MQLTANHFKVVIGIIIASWIFVLFPGLSDATSTYVGRSTTYPTRTWLYDGYTVQRYTPALSAAGELTQLNGTNAFREDGILLLADDGTNALYVMREGTLQLVETEYTLPSIYTCYGCATSVSSGLHPAFYSIGDRALVVKDGDAYLLDVQTMQAELWFSVDVLGSAVSGEFSFAALHDELYAYGGVNHELYLVEQPNEIKLLSTFPQGMYRYGSFGSREAVTFDANTTDVAAYLVETDAFAGGPTVGQIDEGVYVYDHGKLTRLGYADDPAQGYWGPQSFHPSVPFAFGERSVAWIGEDGALYVATLKGSLPNTGIFDPLRGTPFRTYSNSAVYYQSTYGPTGPEVYMTADAYQRAHNDPSFSQVLFVNDAAIDAIYIARAERIF